MKKKYLILLFVLGLSIFLYPIISNKFATTSYQDIIKKYNDEILDVDKSVIDNEKEKVEKHNKELLSSSLNFSDPFTSDKEEKKDNISYYDALSLGEIIASVEIPKINVEIPIYHGTSSNVLSKGAGHLKKSSLPSAELGGHSVITAHRGLATSKLFRDLDKLEIGDNFYIKVLDETIAYEVKKINSVLPNETDWLKMDESLNQMTLLTCEPYMINTHRMLVTGEKIVYNPVNKENKSKESKDNKKINTPIIISSVGLISIVIIIVYINIKRRGKYEK